MILDPKFRNEDEKRLWDKVFAFGGYYPLGEILADGVLAYVREQEPKYAAAKPISHEEWLRGWQKSQRPWGRLKAWARSWRQKPVEWAPVSTVSIFDTASNPSQTATLRRYHAEDSRGDVEGGIPVSKGKPRPEWQQPVETIPDPAAWFEGMRLEGEPKWERKHLSNPPEAK